MDWDDLRLLLAVAEHGSFAAAARALGVDHTTVLRRVNAFEAAHGLRLFDRLPGGTTPTAAGEELAAAARRMAAEADALGRRLAGRDLRLEGTLRLATTDTLMAAALPRHLAAFRLAHPGVRLEVSVANRVADLTRRDADVALRPTKAPPETLIGRRLCNIGFAAYCAAGAEAGEDWLGVDDSLGGTVLARWLRATVPPERIALKLDSLLVMRDAAAAGLGRAALPCYLGDADPRLRRLAPEVLPVPELGLWLLTHADLRRTARVRAFTEAIATAINKERASFEGHPAALSGTAPHSNSPA